MEDDDYIPAKIILDFLRFLKRNSYSLGSPCVKNSRFGELILVVSLSLAISQRSSSSITESFFRLSTRPFSSSTSAPHDFL